MSSPVVVQGTVVNAPQATAGTQVEAGNAEHQPKKTGCNDPIFAILFYGNLAAIFAVAAIYDSQLQFLPFRLSLLFFSVGFCVTFGTLFAKIRRVYLIFMQAAAKNGVTAGSGSGGGVESRNNGVTITETLSVIGVVLLIDVFILTIWTVVDPLEWQRTVTLEDQFGVPLESEGHCTCEHWVGFAAAIAALHLVLLGIACFMCYVARNIPVRS